MINKEIKLVEEKIISFLKEGKKIFASSSFQTHSIPMLHILSEIDNSIPVFFLNTGYHFPETIKFKNEVGLKFNLRILDLESDISKNNQTNDRGEFYYTTNPDYCCQINKVLPIDNLLREYDVWVTGVRKEQNSNRGGMKFIEDSKYHTLRLHPMLNWTAKMIWEYRKTYNLPEHPLDQKGYVSVGCEPCTQKWIEQFSDDKRSVRWEGMNKTECGLHIDLVKNKI